ncbi:MAG: CDP-diacylglycerol--glycerol-3-phosphate 3-phosphatidyltransferase [Syntrophorhabdaceae bacterium]|nr:CDP-diacylglycerol--glycerol-3-phosphate 3-phosphatidyltransferase [Syntrophorhabdaceae bacterium]
MTIVRIVAIPVVMFLLLADSEGSISKNRSLAAFGVFVSAALTDLFDGFLARRYHMVTDLGKLMDPLADKLLMCAALIMLVPVARVPAWMAVIVVSREIGVTALRGLSASEGVIIVASRLGKWKTVILNIGVAMLILHYPAFTLPIHEIGFVIFAVGLVLTIWSGLDYFFRFAKELFKH